VSERSLQDLLDSAESPVELLRNSQAGPNVYPGVPAEFSNWRNEQLAWQNTCVLFNQSYHMADLAVEGPDALKLLSQLGVNSFNGFAVDKAKQFVPCTPDGYVIGDVILFALADDRFNLVGRAPALNWVRYHADTGDYDVQVELDQRTALRTDGRRKSYRYQVQGPNAMQVIEKALGETPPDVKFFNMATVTIGGKTVRVLRHGMAGQPGWELFGPWDEREAVHEALVGAGEEFGLVLVGGRAYGSNALESGWIPSPLPAVYSGESLQSYREWLPASGYEGSASLGGSFASSRIEDYYMTPYELGYGPFVKFDHDFIGREALEKIATKPQRRKVTFAWNADDVAKAFRSMFEPGAEHYKYIDLPLSNYASASYDKVMNAGKMVGISMFSGYSYNERSMLSLGVVDPDIEIGNEVTLVWGEEGGGTQKTTVERHKPLEIRAIVSPVPYSEVARKSYAVGWRTGQR